MARAISLDGVPPAPTLPESEEPQADPVQRPKRNKNGFTGYGFSNPHASSLYHYGPAWLDMSMELNASTSIPMQPVAQPMAEIPLSQTLNEVAEITGITILPSSGQVIAIEYNHADTWCCGAGVSVFPLTKPAKISESGHIISQGYVVVGGALYEPLSGQRWDYNRQLNALVFTGDPLPAGTNISFNYAVREVQA